jgi:hypothetical protein
MSGIRPTRAEMREHAAELAEVRVSALLQAFVAFDVNEDAIHKMLVETLTNTYIAGFANGWDAALDEATEALGKVERFQP